MAALFGTEPCCVLWCAITRMIIWLATFIEHWLVSNWLTAAVQCLAWHTWCCGYRTDRLLDTTHIFWKWQVSVIIVWHTTWCSEQKYNIVPRLICGENWFIQIMAEPDSDFRNPAGAGFGNTNPARAGFVICWWNCLISRRIFKIWMLYKPVSDRSRN